MQKGMSAPILLVLIALILGGVYFVVIPKSTQDIKGASNYEPISNGFSVLVSSTGTWDFYEYLCKDLEECETALNSGVRYSVTSGGETSQHEIVVSTADSWNDFKFVKVYAKPSWGSVSADFGVSAHSEVVLKTFVENQIKVEVAIIPISNVSQTYIDALVSFSGN